MNFFERMNEEKNRLTWSDFKLYKTLGVSKQCYYGWKKNGSIPKSMEAKIAATFCMELLYLKTGEGSKYRSESGGSASPDLPPDALELVNKYLRMNTEKKRTMQMISDALGQPEIDKDAV